MNGFFNINKPQNMTSFDVIAILRKKLGIKRIGHLGTLDPMATGVLPVAVGSATKTISYLDADIKDYFSEFRFGIRTDTDDVWGNPITQVSTKVRAISENEILRVIESFTGIIKQTPPIYSALKKDGKKLYEYAREGKEVEIEPREVYIESIDLVRLVNDDGLPYANFRIRCSKGTYIRSIARDMGEVLGIGGIMSGLTRMGTGDFRIADAIELDDVRDLSIEELEDRLYPVDYVLGFFDKVVLGEWETRLFSNGVNLRVNQWRPVKENNRTTPEGVLNLLPEQYSRLFRVYGNNREFIGMGLMNQDGTLKADRVFK